MTSKIRRQGDHIMYRCPGCRGQKYPGGKYDRPDFHAARVEGERPWGFNGDDDAPTLTPSVKHWHPGGDDDYVCHYFIRNGKIQYCSDSSHPLAGQTVDMEPWEDR